MKPYLLNWPRWKVYTSIALAPYLCALVSGLKVFTLGGDSALLDAYLWLMLLSGTVGSAMIELGACARYTDKAQTELASHIGDQEERIRKLEAQLAALTLPSPTP